MSRDVRRLRELARSSMEPAIKAALDRASRSAIATQKGGVILNVLPGPYATLPDLKDLHNEDLLAAWSQQKTVMSPEGAMPFKLAGMVVGAGADAAGAGASGAPEITVDASRSLDDPWPAVARMAWLALAALLVLVHAPLALIRMRASSARQRALQEYAQQRSAAKPAFF
ncbi:hypothetical protein G6F22_018131 [Rhizopus arrhizus]|nr:hypothetical protein G6F22_018131 [Rhizopus arrhizus]